MLIEAQITKEFFFRGTYGRTYRRTEGEGGGGITCHARALKFSRKLCGYKNLIGEDFDQFTAIKKKFKQTMLKR